MDPATIFQIVGTVVSLGDVVIKCITRLSALKAQFHDAPIIVTSMIGQLHMVKIAQDQLSPLNSPRFGHGPRYHQLAGQIGNALDSFGPILFALSQQLDRYEGVGSDRMTAKSRMGFLHGEREMTNLSILLDRQVNALNLLLQAIQCQTWAQQSDMITRDENQSVLRLAKDCSSSLVGLEDVASFISENTAAISTQFEFDDVLRSTLLYQATERSHLRQAIRAKKIRDRDKISTSSLVQRPPTFGLKQAFQAMKLSRLTTAPGTVATRRGIRVDIRRDIIVESSEDHAITEEEPVREDSSHSNSGDMDGANLATEIGRQTEPLLSGIDSDTPRPHSGLGNWRKAFQRRTSNARETKPYQEEEASQPEMIKVLLLGASGGGKTTLLNTLRLFTEAERVRQDQSYIRTLVWQNALDSVRVVLRAMEELNMDSELTASARRLLLEPCSECDRDPALNPQHTAEVASEVSFLRFVTGLQEASRWRGTYQFHDNGEYYFENINRLAEQAAHRLAATDGDLLRTQVTTTGIHQVIIPYRGSQFCVYDLGGERSERKKWIHAFENVSVVIYPVDTTGYRRSMREDADGDRMREQFMIFESCANSYWFAQSSFIIVFTKMDLLTQYMKEEDVDAFLRTHDVISETEPRITIADDYLGYLERHFRRLVRSVDVRERVQFIRANLVDVDKRNPAIDIFDTLKIFIPSKRVSTPSKKIPTPTREKEILSEKRPVNHGIDELSSEYSASSPLSNHQPSVNRSSNVSREPKNCLYCDRVTQINGALYCSELCRLRDRESSSSLEIEQPLVREFENVNWPLIGTAR
ncbi:G-protein alpha subunit-domain-containing protein [Xylaria longipes]|nr:G-protein alpha subunit-domain-containing protein [Xylaria longipes]